MGSGTTAIAALKSKRHYIGYETNKDYILLAKKESKNAKMKQHCLIKLL